MNKPSTQPYLIADLASNDRPRERLSDLGAEILSNAELIAILLGSGVKGQNVIDLAQSLLLKFGGLSGLHKTAFDELCNVKGIGPAKAAQLKAAIELGRRLTAAAPEEKPVVRSPEDAARLVMYAMGALEVEHLKVMLLDTRNRLIRIVQVYVGSLNASLIRVGEIFREAVRANAASLIIVHNHPSGDPSPSPEDIAVTLEIVSAGKLLDVEVLDHIIIGKNRFVSLKSKGLGFENEAPSEKT